MDIIVSTLIIHEIQIVCKFIIQPSDFPSQFVTNCKRKLLKILPMDLIVSTLIHEIRIVKYIDHSDI